MASLVRVDPRVDVILEALGGLIEQRAQLPTEVEGNGRHM